MPLLLLTIGLAIGGIFLLRLYENARKTKDYRPFLTVLLIPVAGAALLFALTGRWPVAGLFIAGTGYIALHLRQKHDKPPGKAANMTGMTREEAFAVLGLTPGASEEEISSAYKRLMEKLHPDHDGSSWMAAKLNQARETLRP